MTGHKAVTGHKLVTWHDLAPVADDFLTTAGVRVVVDIDLPADPDTVWQYLTADDAVVSWSPLVTGATWTGERGVGAIRTVTLARVVSVREDFYRWDVARRMTFAASAATAPGLRAFAEDYQITERPDGASLRWIVAADLGPRAAGRALGMALRPGVSALAQGLRRRLIAADRTR